MKACALRKNDVPDYPNWVAADPTRQRERQIYRWYTRLSGFVYVYHVVDWEWKLGKQWGGKEKICTAEREILLRGRFELSPGMRPHVNHMEHRLEETLMTEFL